jgi:predicted dienelactone hydrolase
VISLLVGVGSLLATLPPLRAAEELVVRLDGMQLPLPLSELETLAERRSPGSESAPPAAGTLQTVTELEIWLRLLDPASRDTIVSLLRAPLIKERSFGRQLLRSWAGRQLIEELGDFIEVDGVPGGPAVIVTLKRLLQEQPQVTAMDLLRALPARQATLDLEAVVALAARWRHELRRQEALIGRLRSLPLPVAAVPPAPPLPAAAAGSTAAVPAPVAMALPVSHRRQPLPLEIWPSRAPVSRSQWVLLMPGLGSRPDHLHWLARGLAVRGWGVVVMQHPGSDDRALREMLLGRRPPPGAEVLPARLRDLQAVLRAREAGDVPLPPGDLVLVGHSLGALTAFLASGLEPENGLEGRCGTALQNLPLTNLSSLLQCQLGQVALPGLRRPPRLAGIVAFNSFGSLLWPRRGLDPLGVPVLLSGGTLDLITPPLREQLALLAPVRDPSSRVLLVEGGSHFSVIRVERPTEESDLFRLGDELVGVDPLAVQEMLLRYTVGFLEGLPPAGGRGSVSVGPLGPQAPVGLDPHHHRTPSVAVHVLSPPQADRLQRALR